MAEEFKPITTQEEFDAMIKSRLEREQKKIQAEFADYSTIKSSLENKTKEVEELKGKITGFETQVNELNSKLSASETDSAKTRIAYELGLPIELRNRLAGNNEDEIRKDAETLVKLINQQNPAPIYQGEPPVKEKNGDQAYKQMLKDLENLN